MMLMCLTLSCGQGVTQGQEVPVSMGARSVNVIVPAGVGPGDILEVTIPREDLQGNWPWGVAGISGSASERLEDMTQRGDAKALTIMFLGEFESEVSQQRICKSITRVAGLGPVLIANLESLNISTALTRTLYRHGFSTSVYEECLPALMAVVRGSRSSLEEAINGAVGRAQGGAAELARHSIETHHEHVQGRGALPRPRCSLV